MSSYNIALQNHSYKVTEIIDLSNLINKKWKLWITDEIFNTSYDFNDLSNELYFGVLIAIYAFVLLLLVDSQVIDATEDNYITF